MSAYGFAEVLVTQQVAGPTKSSFTTAVSILDPAAKFTLPAGFFANVGKKIRLTGAGQLSNVVTAQPTFTFTVLFGATTVFNGGAMTTSTTAHTNLPFTFVIDLTCRAVGTSANLMGQGVVCSQVFVASGATADGANTHTTLMIPNTAPAVGSNFDSTVSQAVDFFAACGTSNASNAITLMQYDLTALN